MVRVRAAATTLRFVAVIKERSERSSEEQETSLKLYRDIAFRLYALQGC
jgi:hypothetical protein